MSPHPDDRDRIRPTNGKQSESAPAGRDFVATRSLKRQLLAELRMSWEEGQPIPPEDLLNRWPANPENDPDVASLLSEDYWQRRQLGQQPSSEDYRCRFPGQKESLAHLLQQQALLRSCGGKTAPGSRLLALPTVGDELCGFRLCHELGRGSFARVFLAQQKTLAARPVVVKVSAIDSDEPQTLAQLQHTHIVPIYSVHDDTAAGLRIVCMPYFGGATLASVLQALGAEANLPMHGKQLVAALTELRSPESPATDAAQMPLAFLARLSYRDAVVWIIARLAEALQHAHQRGILHRDIKPSNILLGADGQPMLLDFNLAENLRADQALAAATVGGTLAYMAPEHLFALASRDPALARQVDHRADLYALGIVFYELLSGRSPFRTNADDASFPDLVDKMAVERASSVPSLRRHRPDVPWSLESILRKCLAPDPVDRYQQAEHLAEDLRRSLEDRPLKFAPELSWRERLHKWRRRHPRWALSGWISAAAAVLLAVGMTILPSILQRVHRGDQAVAQRTQQLFHTYAELTRCYLNATIGEQALLPEGVDLCEKALRCYAVLERADWQNQAAWRLLDPKEQESVAGDICELLLLLGRARFMLAVAEAEQTSPVTKATPLVLFGWSALPADGLATAAAALPEAEGPWDCARALEGLLAGRPLRINRPISIAELKNALHRNPRDYWSWFHLGMCYRQQGEYALAASAFQSCTALWSEFSWGHFNLGEALHQLGKRQEAIEEYTAATQCWPNIGQAYFNRGLVQLDLGNWQAALDDFTEASEHGYHEAAVHGGRGIALANLGHIDEADAAFAEAWANGRKNVDMLLGYAFLVSRRSPNKAQEILRKVLEQDPHNAKACYGYGMLLENQRPDSEEAVAWFGRALAANPGLVEARLARAVIRARQGRGNQFAEDIDLCVYRQPTGSILYGAACFYALLAERSKEPLAACCAENGLRLLGEALKQGYGYDQAATDPDLDGIRRHPQFHLLLERTTRPEVGR